MYGRTTKTVPIDRSPVQRDVAFGRHLGLALCRQLPSGKYHSIVWCKVCENQGEAVNDIKVVACNNASADCGKECIPKAFQ